VSLGLASIYNDMYLLEIRFEDYDSGYKDYGYYLMGYTSDSACVKKIHNVLSEYGYTERDINSLINREQGANKISRGGASHGDGDIIFEVTRLIKADSLSRFYTMASAAYDGFKNIDQLIFDEAYFYYYDDDLEITGDSIDSYREFFYNLDLMFEYKIIFNPKRNLIR
jgi:hypothetical protein